MRPKDSKIGQRQPRRQTTIRSLDPKLFEAMKAIARFRRTSLAAQMNSAMFRYVHSQADIEVRVTPETPVEQVPATKPFRKHKEHKKCLAKRIREQIEPRKVVDFKPK